MEALKTSKVDALTINYDDYGKAEHWNDDAAEYAVTIEPSTRIAAPRLVDLANALVSIEAPQTNILELGAGTGSLTQTLLQKYPIAPLLATDISPSMLAQLRASTNHLPTSPRFRTLILDMIAPVTPETPKGTFTHIFSTMALQSLNNPDQTLAAWLPLLAPGGVMAIGIWDHDHPLGTLDIWRETVHEFDPAYVDPPTLPKGAWTGRKQLEEGMARLGLGDITSESFDLGFQSGLDGFMQFWWGGKHPISLDRIRKRPEQQLRDMKEVMLKIVREKYENGTRIPLWTALAVGRKL